jgi:cytochrome d ubiquinol oxidase subunit I
MTEFVTAAAADPAGLLPAREQMALSLGWHIILACFGVAFPTMIFVVHRRGVVHEDPVALGLARRWGKAPSPGRSSASRWACCGRA